MPAPILHLTHHRNLPSILGTGGLWSPNHRPPECVVQQSSAYENLQNVRAQRIVPCGPGGNLHDYTPFYFGERSPMLYANHRGFVRCNPEGQGPLIYLVSSAERIQAEGHGFVFTDGHALHAYTRYFDDLHHLSDIDWPTVHTHQWANREDDPDRKRRKQSEFLVYRFMPVSLIESVVVLNHEIRTIVQQIFCDRGVDLPVRIDGSWYY